MATINGITIKSFRSFSGIEYPTIREANVWNDNKKIGTFREDEWGGPAHMTKGLEDSVKLAAIRYQSGCNEGRYKEFQSDPEVFISKILNLAEYEKIYKQNCKKGHPFTLFVGNDIFYITFACSIQIDYSSEANLPKIITDAIRRHFPKKDYCIWGVSDASDLVLTIDENHPIPYFMERIY